MALNPSNLIAARANPGRRVFPNLAYSGSDREKLARIDAQVLGELDQAGIHAEGPAEFLRERREVPAAYLGQFFKWGFRRAWYYWVAEGPGVPPDAAEAFHRKWGTQARVDGHCGCPSPLEWNRGFAVGLYHIDTQEGLNAFAALLRGVYREPAKGGEAGAE